MYNNLFAQQLFMIEKVIMLVFFGPFVLSLIPQHMIFNSTNQVWCLYLNNYSDISKYCVVGNPGVHLQWVISMHSYMYMLTKVDPILCRSSMHWNMFLSSDWRWYITVVKGVGAFTSKRIGTIHNVRSNTCWITNSSSNPSFKSTIKIHQMMLHSNLLTLLLLVAGKSTQICTFCGIWTEGWQILASNTFCCLELSLVQLLTTDQPPHRHHVQTSHLLDSFCTTAHKPHPDTTQPHCAAGRRVVSRPMWNILLLGGVWVWLRMLMPTLRPMRLS